MNEAAVVRFLATDVMGWGKGAPGEMPAIDGMWYPTDMNFIAWFRPLHEIAHAFMVEDAIAKMEYNVIKKYLYALDAYASISSRYPPYFAMVHASPEDRSIAAVRAKATDEQIASWL